MAQTSNPKVTPKENFTVSMVGTKIVIEIETDLKKVVLVKSKGTAGSMMLSSFSLYQHLADIGYTGNINIWKR